MSLYARLDAFCIARPKTVCVTLVVFTMTALIFNPAFSGWMIAILSLPLLLIVALSIAAKALNKRSKQTES